MIEPLILRQTETMIKRVLFDSDAGITIQKFTTGSPAVEIHLTRAEVETLCEYLTIDYDVLPSSKTPEPTHVTQIVSAFTLGTLSLEDFRDGKM